MSITLNFTENTKQAIHKTYQRNPSLYDALALQAYEGEAPDFPIGKRTPLERLVILCRCMDRIYEAYAAMGIPDPIIRNTFSDVSLRARLYEEKTGRAGLSKDDAVWFRHLASHEIFQIGSLQFQPFSMIYLDQEGCGMDFMTYEGWDKTQLPQGSPVINVHIPKGAGICPEAVAYSLGTAEKFFRTYLPERKARCFLCYSWLLYPGLLELLPQKSNIRSFASRFQIIGSAADPYEAITYIYGKRYPRKSDYPQDTSLQRNAVGHFSKLGEACGIRFLEDA